MSTTTSDFRPLDDLGPHLVGSDWDTDPTARWVDHGWRVLAAAGVVPRQPEPSHRNYPDQVVTMAALVYLADLFADESREASVQPPEITGAAPLLGELELGRHAERRGIRGGQTPELPSEVASLAVRERMPTVARALVAELGVSRLFADLWVARHPDELDSWPSIDGSSSRSGLDFPLPDEVVYQVLTALSVSKMITFEWLNEIAPDRPAG